jgi:glycine/D-amino acid oxidase-like deaminating enzyme
MTHSTADVLICGAGIAGIAAAYHLSVRHGIRNIILVDERAPLSLTSDKSTECYRNWWPGPGNAMVRLMNRSIDILEDLARENGNRFLLNRRGYLFVTADPARIPNFMRAAEEAAELGAGPVRYHTGQPGEPEYVPAPAQGF